MVKRYELTDAQWQRIEALLPGKESDPGRTAADNRLFVNGVLWVLRSGTQWHDLPARYGKWNPLRALGQERHMGSASSRFSPGTAGTSTSCSTPPWSARTSRRRPEKGGQNQALGRSRGGLTSKIHMLVDALGHPLRFKSSSRQSIERSKICCLGIGFCNAQNQAFRSRSERRHLCGR